MIECEVKIVEWNILKGLFIPADKHGGKLLHSTGSSLLLVEVSQQPMQERGQKNYD